MRPSPRGGVYHRDSGAQGLCLARPPWLGCNQDVKSSGRCGPWALASFVLLRLCLVLNAGAWRTEGQSSPSCLADGFWGG